MSDKNTPLKLTQCSHCQREVPVAKFCLNCGKELGEPLTQPQLEDNQKIQCPFCSRSVPQTAFCIHCGNPLRVNHVIASPKKDRPITIEEEMEICPLCRQNTPKSHNFCHLCGATLKKSETGPEIDELEKVVCQQCWKPNSSSVGYCIHCGNRLVQQKVTSKFVRQPFNGFQFDVPYFFEPVTLPLSTLRQATLQSIFPIRSTIIHSTYFGVKSKAKRVNFIGRNFGGYDSANLGNYLGAFLLVMLAYIYWYSGRYTLIGTADLSTEIAYTLVMGMLLTSLVMLPTWLSTYFVYRSYGYRLRFRLDSSRVFMTIVFNLIWMIIGYGPIILRMGDFQEPSGRMVLSKQFKRGIVIGVILSTGITVLVAVVTIFVMGLPGSFSGFFLQDHPLKNHILIVFFGATWILLVLLLPIGDYFDKILKEWNLIGYFILIAISFLILTLSFNLIGVLAQPSYQV